MLGKTSLVTLLAISAAIANPDLAERARIPAAQPTRTALPTNPEHEERVARITAAAEARRQRRRSQRNAQRLAES